MKILLTRLCAVISLLVLLFGQQVSAMTQDDLDCRQAGGSGGSCFNQLSCPTGTVTPTTPTPIPTALDLTSIAQKYNLQSAIVKKIGGSVTASYNADHPPPEPASVLKLIIADVFLHGNPNLSHTVTISNREVYGAGESPGAGTRITLHDALQDTLMQSNDNTANALIDAAGGLGSVNSKAHQLGFNATTIGSYYNSTGAVTVAKNQTTVTDLTDAMEGVYTGSGSNYQVAQNALQHDTVNWGLNSEANKWGGTSQVTGNSAVFKINGDKYIITMYDTLNGESGPNTPGAQPIHDATNEIVQDLQSSGSAAPSNNNAVAASNGVGFDDSQSSDTGNQTTVDDDGTDPSPTGSADHQSSTSYADGQLGALHTNYIALNPGWASANGLTLGDVAALTYQTKTIYAVYGDNHVGDTPHAEISVNADMALKGITDPTKTGNLTGVHYVVYPGTHSQLAGSVDQSKIDQIGAQASGGGSPSVASTGSSQCACPGSGSGGSSAPLTGNTPAEQAFNYYTQQKGLPAAGAAGLVGNFMSESGGNTEQLDPTITNSIGAHGIAQWLGGRLTNLVSFASSNSEQEDTLQTQLDFSWHELTTSYASVLGKLKTDTSASQAADDVNSNGPPSYGGGYEGSGVAPVTREANAIKIFNNYGGGASAGGTPASGGASCPSTAPTTAPATGTYQNPFRDITNLGRSRVDQGVDYTGSGNVYAIGDGTVVNTTNSGWPGGTFIVYKLSDGPAAGKYVYFGENCTNIQVTTTPPKNQVTSSTVLCTMVDASPHIETGWADGTRIGDAAAHDVWVGYDSDSYYTAYGKNFSELLQSLGAPPGIIYPGATELGSLPNNWPTW